MKIPYGVADFYSLRTEGSHYVDRTDRILRRRFQPTRLFESTRRLTSQ